jgi:hypothetical protein
VLVFLLATLISGLAFSDLPLGHHLVRTALQNAASISALMLTT